MLSKGNFYAKKNYHKSKIKRKLLCGILELRENAQGRTNLESAVTFLDRVCFSPLTAKKFSGLAKLELIRSC
jgi:hypothetical protein